MNQRLLIDTDVLIEVEKGRTKLPKGELYISCISLYEFLRGRRDYQRVKKEMEAVFYVVPLTNEVMLKAVEIYRDLRKKGELIEDRDLLIAATSIALGIPLFTGNKTHFERMIGYGLKLV